MHQGDSLPTVNGYPMTTGMTRLDDGDTLRLMMNEGFSSHGLVLDSCNAGHRGQDEVMPNPMSEDAHPVGHESWPERDNANACLVTQRGLCPPSQQDAQPVECGGSAA